jgi:hypothetical protein
VSVKEQQTVTPDPFRSEGVAHQNAAVAAKHYWKTPSLQFQLDPISKRNCISADFPAIPDAGFRVRYKLIGRRWNNAQISSIQPLNQISLTKRSRKKPDARFYSGLRWK